MKSLLTFVLILTSLNVSATSDEKRYCQAVGHRAVDIIIKRSVYSKKRQRFDVMKEYLDPSDNLSHSEDIPVLIASLKMIDEVYAMTLPKESTLRRQEKAYTSMVHKYEQTKLQECKDLFSSEFYPYDDN